MCNYALLEGESHHAREALSLLGIVNPEVIECGSTEELYRLVDRGRAEKGVVSMENTTSGLNAETLDGLIFDNRVEILEETVVLTPNERNHGCETRFVVIGQHSESVDSGRDRTCLALFLRENRPGSLLMICQEFAFAEVDLLNIQSRPTKHQLGDFMFYLEVDGHVSSSRLHSALSCLRLKLRDVKVLGSYPRA